MLCLQFKLKATAYLAACGFLTVTLEVLLLHAEDEE